MKKFNLNSFFSFLKKTTPPVDKSKIDQRKTLADSFLINGDFNTAIQHYSQILNEEGPDASILSALAFAYKLIGNYSESSHAAREAIKLDSALALPHYCIGYEHFVHGRLTEAKHEFNTALQLEPTLEAAYPDLCFLHFQSGQVEEAKSIAKQGLKFFPESAMLHYVLGNLYFQTEQLPEAIQAYQAAVKSSDKFIDAYFNLALAQEKTGDITNSIINLQHAVNLNTQFLDAVLLLAKLCFQQKRMIEAEKYARQVLGINPELAEVNHMLGNIQLEQGNVDAALKYYKRVYELEPENAAVLHLINALQGNQSDVAPQAYVEKLFDDFASTFEHALVDKLGYQIPKILAGKISHIDSVPKADVSLLDLGCGTGLAGIELASICNKMVGVDLSGKMLEKAAQLNIYNRLEQKDICEMMQNEPDQDYHLITATDVFVYLGKLDDIFYEAKRLLKPSGIFAFTVEAITEDQQDASPYKLGVNARYRHHRTYLDQLAAKNGFATLETSEVTIRMEKGQPVTGWIYILAAS